MPLLLLNDQNTIDGKNEFRTRTHAAEACRVPEQTNNNEGCGKDLQIGARKSRCFGLRAADSRSKIATYGVDIQDNHPLIWQDREPSPG